MTISCYSYYYVLLSLLLTLAAEVESCAFETGNEASFLGVASRPTAGIAEDWGHDQGSWTLEGAIQDVANWQLIPKFFLVSVDTIDSSGVI